MFVVLREQLDIIDVTRELIVVLSEITRYVLVPFTAWNGTVYKGPPGRDELVGSPY